MTLASAFRMLSLLPLCIAAGCSGTGSTVYMNDGAQAGNPVFYGTVKVYASRDIGQPVEELGSVCVTIDAEVPGDEFIKLMQKQASKIGANAVVAYEQWGHSAVGVAVRLKQGKVGALPSDSVRQTTPLGGAVSGAAPPRVD